MRLHDHWARCGAAAGAEIRSNMSVAWLLVCIESCSRTGWEMCNSTGVRLMSLKDWLHEDFCPGMLHAKNGYESNCHSGQANDRVERNKSAGHSHYNVTT